jgi:DNA-binding transcriptional LysR family regulator
MTQPAVSRQVAALERRVGVGLFHRLPRGVRPTAAGEAALEQAAVILGGMTLLEKRLRSFATADTGPVRVSAFPSAATAFVPECFRRFAQLYPGVELSLAARRTDEPAKPVLEGHVDVALLTSWDPSPMAGVEAVPLVDDELLVALAQDHPLAARERVRLRDLADEPWIEGTHPDCLGPIPQLTAALGRSPRISCVCDDWNGKQGLVAAGIGIMLYPTFAGQDTLRPDIRLLRPIPRLPARTIAAAALPAPARAPGRDRVYPGHAYGGRSRLGHLRVGRPARRRRRRPPRLRPRRCPLGPGPRCRR